MIDENGNEVDWNEIIHLCVKNPETGEVNTLNAKAAFFCDGGCGLMGHYRGDAQVWGNIRIDFRNQRISGTCFSCINVEEE